MRERFHDIILSIIVFGVTSILMVTCEFTEGGKLVDGWGEIIQNILIGIIASSALALLTSIAGYKIEKTRVDSAIFIKLSVIRLKVKSLLAHNITHLENGGTEFKFTINDENIAKVEELNIETIALLELLSLIPDNAKLKRFNKKELQDYCAKVNKMTEQLLNVQAKSGDKISDNSFIEIFDIEWLNKKVGI